MIHILHSKMMYLFKSTLYKFIDDKHIPSCISELLEMDLEDKKKYKAKYDIGTKASSLISKVDALKAKKFYETAEQFLIKVSTYLQLNLPLDEQILFDVKVLHPLQKNMAKATNVIKKLAAVVIHALGKKAKEVFKFHGEDYQFIDLILKEFAEYQIEVIPDTYYLKKKEKKGEDHNNRIGHKLAWKIMIVRKNHIVELMTIGEK